MNGKKKLVVIFGYAFEASRLGVPPVSALPPLRRPPRALTPVRRLRAARAGIGAGRSGPLDRIGRFELWPQGLARSFAACGGVSLALERCARLG